MCNTNGLNVVGRANKWTQELQDTETSFIKTQFVEMGKICLSVANLYDF